MGANRRLCVRNRQRAVPVDGRALRQQALWVLQHQLEWPTYDIGIELVSARRMAQLNQAHLNHKGPTDILTFGYDASKRHGDLCICPWVAQTQAGRFGTTTAQELARYLIHGLLHLAGYDDRHPRSRRRMKQVENRWLRELRAR